MPATRLKPSALKRAIKEHNKRPKVEVVTTCSTDGSIMSSEGFEQMRPVVVPIGEVRATPMPNMAKLRHMSGETLIRYAEGVGLVPPTRLHDGDRESWEEGVRKVILDHERTHYGGANSPGCGDATSHGIGPDGMQSLAQRV